MRILTILTLLSSFSSAIASGPCVPTASWSGRFVLAEPRDPAGGVRVVLENTPASHRNLRGQTVWLRSSQSLRNYDVTFGPRARAAIGDGLVLPTRLDNWNNVSPLESFAAARDNDVIRAEILDPQVEGNVLVTAAEPVLLDGDQRCLAKFTAVNGEEARVTHYNPATGAYDGVEETVSLDFKRHLAQDDLRRVYLRGIVGHATNQQGWDIFGSRRNGRFVVESIEPHGLFRVDAGTYRSRRDLMNYWRLPRKTEARQLVYGSRELPSVGTRYIFAHAFGSYNKEGRTLIKYRGHASIGFAEVIVHPINGALVYQLVYKQTYGQSGEGVFAGTHHSHAYSGNLYRGRNFIRPNVDVLYPVTPELEADISNGMDLTAAGYRVGFGHGWARVTLLTSCVRDTANTMASRLEDWPRDGKGSDQLATAIKVRLGPELQPPARFRNVELMREDEDMRLTALAQARFNLNLAVPRNFQNAIVKAFRDDGRYHIVALQSAQVGDDMPGAIPKPPDSIFSFLGTAIASLIDWALPH